MALAPLAGGGNRNQAGRTCIAVRRGGGRLVSRDTVNDHGGGSSTGLTRICPSRPRWLLRRLVWSCAVAVYGAAQHLALQLYQAPYRNGRSSRTLLARIMTKIGTDLQKMDADMLCTQDKMA